MNMDNLFKMVDKYDVISFDIFDTLIFRNVYKPVDIFKLVEENINVKNKIDNFSNLRIEAESKARENVENSEVNYDEIYNYMKGNGLININAYKKLELQMELDFSMCNPFMKKVFDYAVKKKKKIFIISDMYLRRSFISKYLEKNGYKNVNIYISCEYRESKANMGLYDIVCKENSLDKSKWLHIGDNYISDYLNATNFGINAYHYKNIREYDKSYIPNTIEESILCGIQNNILYNGLELDYWEIFGIKYLSFIYFGFTFWVYQLTKNCDNLYFLARDGYLIKKVYELFPKTNTNLRYLYCSRKTLQIPSFLLDDVDIIVNNIVNYSFAPSKMQTVEDVLKYTGIDISSKKYVSVLNLFGFKDSNDLVNINNVHRLKKVVATILDDIKGVLNDDFEIAKEYLKQEECLNYEKLNIVDIGWAGSIQYAIKKLIDKDVTGYYLGTINTYKKDSLTSTFGWAFDLDNDIEIRDHIFGNSMMYELMFSAPHGSTISYKKQGNKIVPVFGEDDNCTIVEKFQDSALKVIKEYVKYFDYFKCVDYKFCLNNYMKFIENKDYDDLVKFKELSNDWYLGNLEKDSYVNVIPKEVFMNDCNKVQSIMYDSLWRNTCLIDGTDKEEYDKLMKKYHKKISNHDSRVKRIRRRVIPFKIRKFIKDLLD